MCKGGRMNASVTELITAEAEFRQKRYDLPKSGSLSIHHLGGVRPWRIKEAGSMPTRPDLGRVGLARGRGLGEGIERLAFFEYGHKLRVRIGRAVETMGVEDLRN